MRIKNLNELPLSLRRLNRERIEQEGIDLEGGNEKPTNKFNAIPVEADGHHFDSKVEHWRYQELKWLELAGEIRNLKVHQVFKLEIAGFLICSYEADFVYQETVSGRTVIEDVKGVRTPVFIIKKKLMRAIHGIEIKEIKINE